MGLPLFGGFFERFGLTFLLTFVHLKVEGTKVREKKKVAPRNLGLGGLVPALLRDIFFFFFFLQIVAVSSTKRGARGWGMWGFSNTEWRIYEKKLK